MKVLVTGVKGQLGFDCVRELRSRGYKEEDIIQTDIDNLDITNATEVFNFVNKYRPDVIIHCAAYTAVDKAEEDPTTAYLVNEFGTKNLAQAAEHTGAKFVYISTDYVFPGTGNKPFDVNDETGPLNIYGASKLAGEQTARRYCSKTFIVRTSWVFGINGNNYVKLMLKLAETHKTLTIVDDQIGSPTYTVDLAKLLCDMIETDKYGTYHATNEGYCSWAEFAKEIFIIAKKDIEVIPVSTEEYLKQKPQQAKRPLNSRLSKDSLVNNGFNRLPFWKKSLFDYLKSL